MIRNLDHHTATLSGAAYHAQHTARLEGDDLYDDTPTRADIDAEHEWQRPDRCACTAERWCPWHGGPWDGVRAW